MEVFFFLTHGAALGIALWLIVKPVFDKSGKEGIEAVMTYLESTAPLFRWTATAFPYYTAKVENSQLALEEIQKGPPQKSFDQFYQCVETLAELMKKEGEVPSDTHRFLAMNLWRNLHSLHPSSQAEKEWKKEREYFSQKGYETVSVPAKKHRDEFKDEILKGEIVPLNRDEVTGETVWLGLRHRDSEEYLELSLSFYPRAYPAVQFSS